MKKAKYAFLPDSITEDHAIIEAIQRGRYLGKSHYDFGDPNYKDPVTNRQKYDQVKKHIATFEYPIFAVGGEILEIPMKRSWGVGYGNYTIPTHGIYFLLHGYEVVYIGVSSNVYRRIGNHTRDKDKIWDGFVAHYPFLFKKDIEEGIKKYPEMKLQAEKFLRCVEQQLVLTFNPRYNKEYLSDFELQDINSVPVFLNTISEPYFNYVKPLVTDCGRVRDADKHPELFLV